MRKLSLTVESQLVSIVGTIKLENNYLAIIIVVGSGKNHT